MTQQLEIGKDYRFAFVGGGSEATKRGEKMVYKGNDTWEATNEKGQTMTAVSAKTTASALEYINRPSVMMGSIARRR